MNFNQVSTQLGCLLDRVVFAHRSFFFILIFFCNHLTLVIFSLWVAVISTRPSKLWVGFRSLTVSCLLSLVEFAYFNLDHLMRVTLKDSWRICLFTCFGKRRALRRWISCSGFLGRMERHPIDGWSWFDPTYPEVAPSSSNTWPSPWLVRTLSVDWQNESFEMN